MDATTTLEELHGCVLDYACCHQLMDVVQEVCSRQNESLSSLQVPHGRLASAALFRLVTSESITDFPTAIKLAEKLFLDLGSVKNLALVRCYAKLMCGLKVKVLFHTLQVNPKEVLSLLRKYFPQGQDGFQRTVAREHPELSIAIKEAVRQFRKCILPLVGHENKRNRFMSHQFEKLYGSQFSLSLSRRVTTFVSELEKGLPDTYIDELLKLGPMAMQTDGQPTDFMFEILLNCVEGKTTLSSADLLGVLEDLNPQASPNLLGFQSGFIVSSCPVEPASQPANSCVRVVSADVHVDRHTPSSSAASQSTNPPNSNDTEYESQSDEEIDDYSDEIDTCHRLYAPQATYTTAPDKKRRKSLSEISGNIVNSSSKWPDKGTMVDGKATRRLQPCHVKLCFQKELSSLETCGIPCKLYT